MDEQTKVKSTSEIKNLINKALVKNEILGHLNKNLLYMQSFEKKNSIDKIFYGIGIIIIFVLSQYHFSENQNEHPIIYILFALGIASLILGRCISGALKFYLVYDIDKEVFYSVTYLFNKIINKTNEISISDFIELGVNVTDLNDSKDAINQKALFFKGDKMDNPGLRTFLVGLRDDGKIISITDPEGLRKPHEAAVARCKLFAECFGLNSVICDKNEYLKAVEDETGNYKLVKNKMDNKIEKANSNAKSIIIFFTIFFLIVFLASIFIAISLKK